MCAYITHPGPLTTPGVSDWSKRAGNSRNGTPPGRGAWNGCKCPLVSPCWPCCMCAACAARLLAHVALPSAAGAENPRQDAGRNRGGGDLPLFRRQDRCQDRQIEFRACLPTRNQYYTRRGQHGKGSRHSYSRRPGPRWRWARGTHMKQRTVCVVVCCSTWQCVAVCCSVLPCVAVFASFLLVATRRWRWARDTRGSKWRCVHVCCSLLHCVVVCCSELQCLCHSYFRQPGPRWRLARGNLTKCI